MFSTEHEFYSHFRVTEMEAKLTAESNSKGL